MSKLAVRKFVKRMNREHHTTIILTTHDMQDIEALAGRIILIGKGHVLLDGTLADMRRIAGSEDVCSLDEIVVKLYEKLNIV